MTDPVTNVLAMELTMGDEELRKEVEARIRGIVVEELSRFACGYAEYFNIRDQFLNNSAGTIGTVALRALRTHLQNHGL